MAIVTSQQIKEYFDRYGNIDVTFTKDINDSLQLIRNQIYLKYRGGQRPCIIYSSSMNEAKVVIAMTEELLKTLRDENLVSLRYCFKRGDKGELLSFIVQCRISGLTQYDKERNLHFAQLKFTQRPPDDLIEVLGNLLEANINAARRAEERIVITADSLRRLGFGSKNVVIQIDGVPRNGIIRDVSFGGSKVIIMGNPKFLVDKPVALRFTLSTGKFLTVIGKIVRFETVEGRKDLAAVAVKFVPEKIPFAYKMIINDYLKHLGKSPGSRVAAGNVNHES